MRLPYRLREFVLLLLCVGEPVGANQLYRQILSQYRSFRSAKVQDKPLRFYQSRIDRAELLRFSGQFRKSLKLLDSIDESLLGTQDYVRMLEIKFHNYLELGDKRRLVRQVSRISKETKYLHFLKSAYVFDRLQQVLGSSYKTKFVQYAEKMLRNYPYTASSRKAFQYLQSCDQNTRIRFSIIDQLARFHYLSPGIGDWIMDRLDSNMIRYPRRDRKRYYRERLRLRVEEFGATSPIEPKNRLKRFSGEDLRLASLYAKTYEELGQVGKASSVYSNYLRNWGRSRRTIPLWSNFGHFLSRQGDVDSASEEFRNIFKQSRTRRNRWFAFWYTFRSGDLKTSLEFVESSYMRSLDRQYPAMRFYWQARNYERLGRVKEAWEIDYKILSKWGGGYYASLILNRYQDSKSRNILATQGTVKPMSGETGSQGFDVRLWRNQQQSSKLRVPRSFSSLIESVRQFPQEWKKAYPRPYINWAKVVADHWGAGTSVIYSIIRAESFYNSAAKSPVGARGLMQIMPYTGYNIAEELGDLGFQQDDLMDPIISILYGGYYYSRLLDYYKGNIFYAVAAYNAGPFKVDQWLKLCKACDQDEFVESIPFKETRNYVKRVITSLAHYSRIYDDIAFPKFKVVPLARSDPFQSKLY